MEKDKTNPSQPGGNEEREDTQNGNLGTFIRVLPARAPSLEDLGLVEPLDLPPPSEPPTGPEDQLEATSESISGVESVPPGTASSSTTSASQWPMKTACSSSLFSRAKLTISVVSEVLQLINDRLPDLLLDLDTTRDVPGAQTCSTSATELLALETLTKVSAMLQADADSQAALRQDSGTSSPDLQVEAKAEADLASVAAEVIVAVIKNILAAWAILHPEAHGPGSFSCMRFLLSSVCAHVQALPLLRRSGSSGLSSGRSLGELLTSMSRTKVVQAVELKLEEQFGPCKEDRSSTSPSSLSLDEDPVTIPYLGCGRSLHSLASDLVNEVIYDVKSAVELLDSRPSSSSSSLTGLQPLDFSSVAQKMVCQAAAKLASCSSMGDSDCGIATADGSVSLMNNTSLEGLSRSFLRLLLVRSVDTVTTACRAISSEFCYRESAVNIGLTKLQQLANEQMLACINKGVEELEIDEIVRGFSAILDQSLILRRPETSFSHIYRSLFVDCPLPRSERKTTEVLETLIFLRPQSPPTAEPSRVRGKRAGNIIKGYATSGKGVFEQALRRAKEHLSRKPPTPRGSPHAVSEGTISDAGTASTSAGQTRRRCLKWWSLSKNARIFKNKFLKRKIEPKMPSAQEELLASAHITPGAECGSSANLELSKDQETDQEPRRCPLHVRMFRALRKSIAKTFKMSGSQ